MLFTELPRTLLPNPFYLLQLVATNEQQEHKVHYNRGARSSSHLRRTIPHTSCLGDNTKEKAGHANLWARLAIAGKRQKSKTDPSTLVGTGTFFGKRHTRRWPPKIQSMSLRLQFFWWPARIPLPFFSFLWQARYADIIGMKRSAYKGAKPIEAATSCEIWPTVLSCTERKPVSNKRKSTCRLRGQKFYDAVTIFKCWN